MTPERWRRVEELFHAARARPQDDRSSFLATACPDDTMRRDVQSLLDESDSDDDFLVHPELTPAFASAAVVPAAMTGGSLGGYHVLSLLGAGGMGEVYRARDATLDRDVAIKVLPRAFTSNPDRLARFEREARMLASLNHPNICGIYGLEESDGVRFLILELVEGDTLAVRGRRGLPLDQVWPIARQIADALEAAHEKGIVHRDLKPANIKITCDRVVKVLDFGLAKAVGGDSAAPSLTRPPGAEGGSDQGGPVVIGTAAYMSPEQARGAAVDKRTDIWAFGCVVYEMLTGRVTFDGETASDSIAKILEREPDWSALPPATPVSIRRLLLRCLAKDPKKRLRDIGDARIEIDAIDEVVPGAPADMPPPSATRLTRFLPWVALLLLATAIAVWETRRPRAVPSDPFADARFTRVTDWPGSEGGAEISPDGKFVAFMADRDGEFDLWRTQVGTSHFENLTLDLPSLSAPRSTGLMRYLGFSGDGTEIWLSSTSDAAGPKALMPLAGGTKRPFLREKDAAPSWSPDGRRLVHFNNSDGDPLFLADRTGADPYALPLAEDARTRALFGPQMHNHNPIWSPDPDDPWIYFTNGQDPTDGMTLMRVRPSGGSPEPLTSPQASMNYLAALDARTLLYVARAQDRSGPWLWTLDVPSRITRRVVSGPARFTSVSASRDGRRVVVTSANPSASLWSVPILPRLAEDGDAVPYEVQTERALAPRFGGLSLFFLSANGTGDGLSRFQDGKTVEIWNGADAALAEPAAVAPGGQRVAVIVRNAGERHLKVLSADGTNVRTLAPSISVTGTADWSPDGRWIAVGGRDADGAGLFMIPVDDGPPIKLVSGRFNSPVWSPDGTFMVYGGPLQAGRVPLFAIRRDRTPIELPALRTSPSSYRFLPDGSGLVYLTALNALDFRVLDLATKASRPLTRLSYRGALGSFDITPDGKRIVFDRSRENSDIYLIERGAYSFRR